MDGVRDWLVACGATFGCREVHHYRWPDAIARPEVPYITYRAERLDPIHAAVRSSMTSGVEGEDSHTVLSATSQQFEAYVRVDLYNSEYGLGWLAKCAIACEKEQAIKNIFAARNIGFKRIVGIEDMTDEDDERIYYHQRLSLILRTSVTHVHKNYNYKVDTVDSTDAISIVGME